MEKEENFEKYYENLTQNIKDSPFYEIEKNMIFQEDSVIEFEEEISESTTSSCLEEEENFINKIEKEEIFEKKIDIKTEPEKKIIPNMVAAKISKFYYDKSQTKEENWERIFKEPYIKNSQLNKKQIQGVIYRYKKRWSYQKDIEFNEEEEKEYEYDDELIEEKDDVIIIDPPKKEIKKENKKEIKKEIKKENKKEIKKDSKKAPKVEVSGEHAYMNISNDSDSDSDEYEFGELCLSLPFFY
jgi:hypothetical protein